MLSTLRKDEWVACRLVCVAGWASTLFIPFNRFERSA